MGRKKKEIPEKVVDTRTEDERMLDSFRIRMRGRGVEPELSETEKKQLEGLVSKLEAAGIENEFKGIGKFYSVQMNGGEEPFNFKLVAASPRLFAEPREISLTAPLGNSVRNLKVGDMSSYVVVSQKTTFKLIAVAGTYEELQEKVKSLGIK